VAIVQISQITNRKGLQIDLPQLAGAELGWSIDERRLWIGNGTLAEGAPVVGNTEILTEFSDILELSAAYTYKGQAAGYTVQTGPTPGTPVTQSLQSWFDQWATVKDFGAVGDGITDDTEAINRAMYQIYCREVNPQIRRAIFFPAGVYRVTETILIPPYATLYGEGPDNSIIQLDNSVTDSSFNEFVARTCDSLFQSGINIGSNGATPPQYITITNMGFETLDPLSSVFLVDSASDCRFQSTGFFGSLTAGNLTTDINDTAAVRFASLGALITNQIVFDNCEFSGTVYGLNTATSLTGTDQEVNGVTVTDSKFNLLYQGILLGTQSPAAGNPTGVRIVSNVFDNIYAQGIIFGATTELNASGQNIFYDVGNHFAGISSPATAIIDIQSNNNVSIGDMFARTDAFATTWPRVSLNQTQSIATVNGSKLAMGSLITESSTSASLNAGEASPVAIFTMPYPVSNLQVRYEMQSGGTNRTGTFVVAGSASGVSYTDDYSENAVTDINLSASQSGAIITVSYTSGSYSALMRYSISYISTYLS